MNLPAWPRTKFVRFLAIGLVNTLFGYLAFAILIYMGISEVAAVPTAMVAGTLFNFISYGKYVFASLNPRRLPKFVMAYLLLYACNLGGLRGLARVGMGPYAGQAILTLPLVILAYVFNDRWVFRAN